MSAATFRWFKFLIIGASLLAAIFVGVAVARAAGTHVKEICKVTVYQTGYVAGVCPVHRYVFGTRTRRTFRMGELVTVSGYLDGAEITYPTITRFTR